MILLSQVDLASGLGFEEACYAQVSNPCIFCLTSSTSLNWNPHSLLLITPNPTPSPSTQLTLVYNTYVYPHREEEKDSRMAGFKLGVFYKRHVLIGPQESCCSTIGRTQKAVWILIQMVKSIKM